MARSSRMPGGPRLPDLFRARPPSSLSGDATHGPTLPRRLDACGIVDLENPILMTDTLPSSSTTEAAVGDTASSASHDGGEDDEEADEEDEEEEEEEEEEDEEEMNMVQLPPKSLDNVTSTLGDPARQQPQRKRRRRPVLPPFHGFGKLTLLEHLFHRRARRRPRDTGPPEVPSSGLPPFRPPHAPRRKLTRRDLWITSLGIATALCAALMGRILIYAIHLFTNLAFYQRWSLSYASPALNTLGAWVIPIPLIGSLFVAVMIWKGVSSIRGTGIPEAMLRIAYFKAQIPVKMMFLKPLCTAIVIGTGGPFGLEGYLFRKRTVPKGSNRPIIATGAAIGSFVGSLVHISLAERRILLATGASAGMVSIFGTPLAAILISVELLLMELQLRSLLTVAIGTCFAAMARRYAPAQWQHSPT